MRSTVVLVAGALLLAGCATVPPRTELVAAHARRARALERDGQLRAALLEWKVARAIDPEDGAARTEQTRLEARIGKRVAERLAEARAAVARGAQSELADHAVEDGLQAVGGAQRLGVAAVGIHDPLGPGRDGRQSA